MNSPDKTIGLRDQRVNAHAPAGSSAAPGILLPAGAVVGAFQLIDAVNAGTLDGGHGVSAYWFGKNKAFSLFGTPPAWFWTPTTTSPGSITAAARRSTTS
jgi:hypothetical protein